MEEIVATASSTWKHWHYKNTAILVASLVTFFFFIEHPIVKGAITYIGNFGYLGAFVTGILFVSVFTVAPAAVALFFLAENLNPLLVALFAGVGGVVGDYVIFKFFKDKVFEELTPLFLKNGGNILVKLFKTPHFSWVVPMLGAMIIVSPFPDELGLGLLGATKIKNWQFLLLTFVLDTVGVLLIIVAAKSF